MQYVKQVPPMAGRPRIEVLPLVAKLKRHSWLELTPKEMKSLTKSCNPQTLKKHLNNGEQKVVLREREIASPTGHRIYARLY